MNLRVTAALLSALFSTFGYCQEISTREKKCVFIIVDGIAYDMLEKADIPNIRKIAKEGALLNAFVGGEPGSYSESPTISAVGYNSVLTGTWTNKHNVWDNDIAQPNYNYPTIFRMFKDSRPEGKTAIFSTWLDNRTKLIGDKLPQTRYITTDIHFDGYELDKENFPHDKNRLYIKNIDRLVANKAAETIAQTGPDLSWVYLEFTDDVGHGYGDSPQLYKAISFEDNIIGNIYDAVKQREEFYNEDWLFIVTTDHGRTAEDGRHHGGQSYREKDTWILINKNGVNNYARQTKKVAAVDILPTIINFLGLKVNDDISRELDGQSLLSTSDLSQLSATYVNGELVIRWNPLNFKKGENVSIYLSTTNNKKHGGTDIFKKIGESAISSAVYQTKIKLDRKSVIKISAQTKNQIINTWVK